VEELSASLDAARAHDVVVFSGGSSVGERDLILDVLHQRGTVHFHGIAVKPGKPTVFGSVGDTPVFGMPGYPTSCLSNAYMLLVPFLRQVARLPAWTPRERGLDGAPRGRPGRTRVQGLRRYHQHGARRRVHRNPGADGRRRGRDGCHGQALLREALVISSR
jgi:molybdopterin biosynthesis enzyme